MEEAIVVSNTPRKVMMSAGKNRGIAEAERELAELLANRGQAVEIPAETEETENEEVTEQVEKPEPKTTDKPVETGWEKRYKDAQRYINKLKDQIKELETKTTAVTKPPKSKEEVEAWMKKYPDVAAIVETIASGIASEKAENLYGPMSEQMERFEEMRIEGIIARTEAAILKSHPDYLEIKEDNAFHKWAEDLPKAMQAVLYDTIDDPKGVVKIINMYKLENGITNDREDDDRVAARAVRSRGGKTEAKVNKGSYDFLESEIERMSMDEYMRNEQKIREAREKNRIKYDISA